MSNAEPNFTLWWKGESGAGINQVTPGAEQAGLGPLSPAQIKASLRMPGMLHVQAFLRGLVLILSCSA